VGENVAEEVGGVGCAEGLAEPLPPPPRTPPPEADGEPVARSEAEGRAVADPLPDAEPLPEGEGVPSGVRLGAVPDAVGGAPLRVTVGEAAPGGEGEGDAEAAWEPVSKGEGECVTESAEVGVKEPLFVREARGDHE
jgi:hypothetical protein